MTGPLAAASAEIADAIERAERTWRRRRVYSGLLAGLERVLGELEELQAQGTDQVPRQLRMRTRELLSLPVVGHAEDPGLAGGTRELISSVFRAQDAVMRLRHPNRDPIDEEDRLPSRHGQSSYAVAASCSAHPEEQ
jgi:hypothetical protein